MARGARSRGRLDVSGSSIERCRFERRDGSRCKRAAQAGGYCSTHVQHGALGSGSRPETGRFSRAPERLRAALEAARKSDELWSSDASLALLDVRIGELLARLGDEGEPSDSASWREMALRLFERARSAAAGEDPEEFRTSMVLLRDTLKAGADRDRAWAEILEAVKLREERADRAQILELRGQYAIPARHLEAILLRILDIVAQEAPQHADAIVQRAHAEVLGEGAGDLQAQARARERAALRRLEG